MLDSTLTLIGLFGISELAKKTDTVYVPGEDGVYSILNVPSWLSMVLTGTSLPCASVNAMAISPVEKRKQLCTKVNGFKRNLKKHFHKNSILLMASNICWFSYLFNRHSIFLHNAFIFIFQIKGR